MSLPESISKRGVADEKQSGMKEERKNEKQLN